MEDLGVDILMWVVSNIPMAGVIVPILAAGLFCVDFYVSVSENKKDDAWWAKRNEGYLGMILAAIRKFSPFKNKI